MQKYSVGTDVKHRYTDMFRIWRQPSANPRFGYSAKFLHVLLVFPSLFPL